MSVPLQLQLLLSQLLLTDRNEVLSGGRRIECGIEFDAIWRRIGIGFCTSAPVSKPASTILEVGKKRACRRKRFFACTGQSAPGRFATRRGTFKIAPALQECW